MLIHLRRVQHCSGRGETPARCSCSGSSRVIGASSILLSPSKDVRNSPTCCSWTWEGAVKLWHVYCRSCQCCYQQQMSRIHWRYYPPTRSSLDAEYRGGFSFKNPTAQITIDFFSSNVLLSDTNKAVDYIRDQRRTTHERKDDGWSGFVLSSKHLSAQSKSLVGIEFHFFQFGVH